MKKTAAVSTLLTLACLCLHAQSTVVVGTSAGKLAGTLEGTSHISVFKGVPFAAPPIGDLRWREPQPVTAWQGIRQATKFGASCMQRLHGDFLPWTREYLVQNEVSEDCLYLNVWTPYPASSSKLAVLVYIPGGGFMEGSGEVPVYDGTNLAGKGLVVVTVNYRLGALGFLAHPALTAESPHHASGNYGLLDQIAALEWVQKNIAAFGGDPTRVTAWGQSAGAFSVGALLASNKAKGLFQRAMADSGMGVAGFHFADRKTAEERGTKWAADRHAGTLKELRALPSDQLVSGDHFAPIVDGWLLRRGPDPTDTDANAVPVITGYQANDGLLFAPQIRSAEQYGDTAVKLYGSMAEQFKQLYPVKTSAEIQTAIQDSARDRERVSMFLWAKARTEALHTAVFTYFFDRGIPWPQHPEFGAFHSGELPYFFSNLQVLDRPWTDSDRHVSTIVIEFLKNFAANGNPNGSGVPHWPAVKPSEPQTLEIGDKIEPMRVADEAKYRFWLQYFQSKEADKAPTF